MKSMVCVMIACTLLPDLAAPVRGMTTNDLADLCQAMESAIVDVSVSYTWQVCPPPKIEDMAKIKDVNGRNSFSVNKGPQICTWVAKRPFGEKYLFISKVTVVNVENPEALDCTLVYSRNGEIAKSLSAESTSQTEHPFPPRGLVSKASAVSPPLNTTPISFTLLRFSFVGAKTLLSQDLRKKGFVDFNEAVQKVNGFNTVCASLLLDTPSILVAHKQPYLRIRFSVDHGYTPVKYEYFSPSKSGPRLNYFVDVNSLSQVAKGLWFPTGGSLVPVGSSPRNVYKASKVAVNRGLTDPYFTIEFPAGTSVEDGIAGNRYVVEPGQSRFKQWLQSDEWLGQAGIAGNKSLESGGSR
jgi:hypothetical protein